jgi:putative hemolysin
VTDTTTLIELFFVIILVSLSAFFSSSETAFIGVNRIKILHLAEKGNKRAKIIHEQMQHPEKLLTTVLIGNNIVNVSASVLVTVLVLNFFGSTGIAIATGIMTVIILVFGEIMPKTYATRHADTYSLKIAYLLQFLTNILFPVVYFLTAITKIILRIMGIKENIKNPFITEDQIKLLLKVGVEEGVIERHEREYIQNVFEFTDEKAKGAMTEKKEMVTVENTERLDRALTKMNESGHSRLPVWKGNFDNIIGMIYAKDLLKYRYEQIETITAEDIIRPILTVRGDRRIANIFKELQVKNIQIAVVIDENKKVVGILSIEDIIEKIVGEIHDEYDIEEMDNGI